KLARAGGDLTTSSNTLAFVVLCLFAAGAASAQTAGQAAQSSRTQSSSSDSEATRPGTPTFLGDTGLWFVPTAEVLAAGKWSASGYRRGTNYIQGFSNVGDIAATV